MDSLSDVLSSVHFKGTIYCQANFTAPWGLKLGEYPGHTGFLVMVRGSCLLDLDGHPPLSLTAGDLMLSPTGKSYTIRDSEQSPVVSLEEFIAGGNAEERNKVFNFGGGGQLTSVIMGCFEFDGTTKNPLVGSLPELLFIKAEELTSEPWLETTLRFLASETARPREGTDLVINRLTDLFFIQAIRAHIGQVKNCPASTGWLRAIGDSQIGAALNLIHERTEAPWTVQSLAEAVSMSRSTFAAKFAAFTGAGPLDYVTNWRMQKARELLELNHQTVAEIALKVGYQSEPAFRKAFKRVIGKSPGEFRKHNG
jgi:AraC-like DNA-binding protein